MSTEMSDTTVKRPERTNATKQKLFDASMQLIGERGPAEVTVDEIAAAAGVSKGTVYYNFGSKTELISQLLEYGVSLLEQRLAPDESLPSLEALERMLSSTLDFFEEYPSFTQLLVSELWRTPSAWRDTLVMLRERLFLLAGNTLSRVAQEHPVREEVQPQAMVGLTLGATLIVGLDRQVFHPERSKAEALTALMTVMTGYLRD
ncbi:TetR/AcrR family transcriptional regulator [Psychromicrobium lacuslunae]|uniref:TetR family transcriptional regulator n=1 Tax=Psychromicrobium lacuslunae TaxID=1618207 RepID=A0A0D4C0C7_9MICC|nr:TetR/AcrR family transcriptional regulator [Psychromicrobium lacuslunae]AJT42127.1 TetR family transcriptional regulator [Psychromicrobium lacuslunae]